MEEKEYELIKFNDGDFTLDVNVSPSDASIWLTQKQIADNELSEQSTVKDFFTVQFEGNRKEKICDY